MGGGCPTKGALRFFLSSQRRPGTALASAWTQWLEKAEDTDVSSTMCERETAQSWEYFWECFEEYTSEARHSGQFIHVFKHGICPRLSDPKNAHGGIFKLQAHAVSDAETLWSYLATKMVLEKVPRCSIPAVINLGTKKILRHGLMKEEMLMAKKLKMI